MSAKSQISLFVTKYLPFKPIFYALGVVIGMQLIFFGELAKLSVLPMLVMFSSLLLTKHKIYKFKLRQLDCEKFFSHFQKNFPKFNFDNNYYCKEIFDKHNNFQYTEIIIPLNSDYRVIIEESDIINRETIPRDFPSNCVNSYISP